MQEQDLLKNYDEIRRRLDDLTRQMGDPKVLSDAREAKRVGRERSRLEKIQSAMDAFREARDRLRETEEILEGDDEELREIAREEHESVEEGFEAAETELKRLLTPRDPADDRNAIVEVRAGTGGEEAALFARDIFRMYTKFAEEQGYRVEELSSSPTGIGGLREIIFSLEGEEAYGTFKFESGVHRVQRVPETEASGRIHTSAITVAVLPEAEEVDIKVEERDLEIDVFRSSGPGGQSVNTTDSAVRIKHLPTGLVVQCQDERSQLKNKIKAMKVLRARLLDMERQRHEEELARTRRSMVSTGDRSAKIRTYNYPQGRVTDHRIGLTLYNLPGVMEGNIGDLIRALQVAEAEAALKTSPVQ
ncbi:MAG: peptide chain release factor 1 [Candidatus Eisenbacteria bacterium]|nr:peptide chain release factor 1 [Candidatus Latescibacterota bacterium]MBD3303209.1 peptide chain release factor 1 [Candidatus Eisenbacteria bacterium]